MRDQCQKCKYEGAGPFGEQLVERAVKVIRERYPIAMIDDIVSVPPTRSGTLVEDFARKVAFSLGKVYLPVINNRQLIYVRQAHSSDILPGNQLLIEEDMLCNSRVKS